MNPAVLYPPDQKHLTYPRNAQSIIGARAQGLKPSGPVMVVMTKKYHPIDGDAHVYIDAGQAYRWDWVRGLLSVVVVIDASTKIGSLLHDIQLNSPKELDMVDCERMKGWKICLTYPRLMTTKWPVHQVYGWLGKEMPCK